MVADAKSYGEDKRREHFRSTDEENTALNFRGSFSGREANDCFVKAGERYVEAGFALGLDSEFDSRGVAPLDIDGDGDLDLAMLSLQGLQVLLNDGPPQTSLRIRLRGRQLGRHALHSRVTVHVGDKAHVEDVRLTEGFHTQQSAELHFGLRGRNKADLVEVRWPSGAVHRLKDLPAGQYTLDEEAEAPKRLELKPWAVPPKPALRFSVQHELATPQGGLRPLAQKGRPVVLNFWAPWCKACVTELPELAKVVKAHPEVDFVGVPVETKKLDEVEAFATKHGLSWPLRLADDALVRSFFGASGEMTLPATFVFGADHRLRRAFFREIDAPMLEAIFATLEVEVTPFDLTQEAISLAKTGDKEGALQQLRKAVKLAPDDAYGHWRLGQAANQLNELELAFTHFDKAMKLAPNDDGIRIGMAKLYAKEGRHAEAEQIMLAGPPSAALWENIARARVTLGRPGEAKIAFEKSIELNPERESAWKAYETLRKQLTRPQRRGAPP